MNSTATVMSSAQYKCLAWLAANGGRGAVDQYGRVFAGKAPLENEMDLLLHNLRTIGTHHCDGTVGEEAAQEIERLRGENAVLLGLLGDAAGVIRSIDPEDGDEAEQLREMLEAIDRAQDPHRHEGALL